MVRIKEGRKKGRSEGKIKNEWSRWKMMEMEVKTGRKKQYCSWNGICDRSEEKTTKKMNKERSIAP